MSGKGLGVVFYLCPVRVKDDCYDIKSAFGVSNPAFDGRILPCTASL